jgi:hypothetical protein
MVLICSLCLVLGKRKGMSAAGTLPAITLHSTLHSTRYYLALYLALCLLPCATFYLLPCRALYLLPCATPRTVPTLVASSRSQSTSFVLLRVPGSTDATVCITFGKGFWRCLPVL